MNIHETFGAEVVKSFGFLETEYGLIREPLKVAGVGSWVSYANASLRVVVEYDIGGYCGVSVENLRHVKRDPLERSDFDLDEIVSVSGQRPPRRPEPRSMPEVVSRAAETLRTVGAPVLKGDFEALHARQRKHLEAVGVRSSVRW